MLTGTHGVESGGVAGDLWDPHGRRAGLGKRRSGIQRSESCGVKSGTFPLNVELRFRSEERSCREGDAILVPSDLNPLFCAPQCILSSTMFILRNYGSDDLGLHCL